MKADLSIIVTNYNKTPEMITECFQSIREQTVLPKEIILVDDGSSDPRAHADAVSILLPRNSGVSKARDIGVHNSTGKLLLFLDADDKLSPDFIEQCGRVIAKKDIAYPTMLLFGEIEHPKLSEPPKTLNPRHLMSKKCRIPVTSMMYRKVYEGLGGFRELVVFEDWDFWLRAMFNGYTFGKANTLLMYRQTAGSRNRIEHKAKEKAYKEMTAPYKVEGNKLCLAE